MLTVFTVVKSLVTIPVLSNSANQFSIAVVHTAFNVVGTAILYPFTGLLEKLATITVGNKKGENDNIIALDECLIATPAIAIKQCKIVVDEMSSLSLDALEKAFGLFDGYSEKTFDEIGQLEDLVDLHEYLHGVKEGDDFRTEYFNKKYKMYKEKYALGSAE